MAPRGFAIGAAAAGGGHHLEQDYPDPFTFDHTYRGVLAEHFSSLTPENQLKWEFVHPERHKYNFGPADAIVRFAQRHGQKVRGHTLLWHSQNPAWLNEGNFSAEELRKILKEHIFTVVGRYRGKIHQWDVANEIFDGDGNYRTSENIWLRTLGPGIIADAFRWAHQADPKAKLFLNDFGAEGVNARSTAYLNLVKELRAVGVPVHGFGVQGHLSLAFSFPSDMAANLKRFDDAGFETAVTEVDVRIPLNGGTATEEQLRTQADYYRQAVEACLSVRGCTSFTVWGTTNRYSWVPVFFPNEGEATIFTDDFRPKPAYTALQTALAKARR
ncbi:endo-1,4-beta-xylanase [Thermopolyspora sp. NPDC052614]|uniref:endo-1,4-beta-xylanase n=1 Tax=Thermopolyspora sp. NPDC052614 TaxID=3155682 RepID=UPI00341647C7